MLGIVRNSSADRAPDKHQLKALLDGFSIEVMPRTAAKIAEFKDLLPTGTRVYIAHIEGTPIEDMVALAKRLHRDGFRVMPHFPARIIKDNSTLEDWIKRYTGDAGVSEALLLAGGVEKPYGIFESSMQLMETGLFKQFGFERLHVAGHPEGNLDIDRDGSTRIVDEALQWKQAYSERTDTEMVIVTQFAFHAGPIISWSERLRTMGMTLPIHVGIAGPAKLQTLLKYAVACGVGPSLKVLQKRAMDVSKLLVPYEPIDVLSDLATYKANNPDSLIENVHFFPLGGIKASANWAVERIE
ncbi:methylenetetrahydrofolate reductase [Oricola thermophila]|uniref:Methylenetetrahydrofolate reductase n=1 Tax=Oricola thermophila TaxID=2742145 RepID=A0A6N1V8K3_9HYPH|nr:methylenetetrahydrofolate reductase [Oricola thermophila]QKV17296.1 methylenetetrahydrofolate reductase [Oricola thermophila]